ncbi:hypothetical protein JXL21_08255 [Candidatus Bathyarchaeota archaeon]|nr:hypothetical protein [Candidatus Bathyarchaeota archaeon]
MAVSEGEEIPSMPLIMRRRLLGYLIPAFNLPLFAWNVYQMYLKVQGGMNMNSSAFIEESLITLSALFLAIFIPRFFPVYKSTYRLGKEGLTITRFLKRKVVLPYRDISRAEVFIRMDEEISKDAKDYAMDSSTTYRRSGFKFKDYTNAEDTILNLFVDLNIYMLSPQKPKALLKELRKRNKKFSAKVVELTKRGKHIQELGR